MTQNRSAFFFLQGGGEMGQLIRQYNWLNTSLGNPDEWPQSLRTALNILINSKFPMFLFWGQELICFYNDAFRQSMGNDGKHPAALGKKGEEVWAEIWPTIKTWIDHVLQTGESIGKEDQLLPIYRNGKLEDVYWTFSYSALSDETGKPAGVFVTCSETTKNVLGLKKLITATEQFKNLVMQAPVAIAVFRGDNFIVEIANDAYLPIVDKKREEFVGKPLFEVLPETRAVLEPLARQVVSTGQPFPASEFEINIFRKGKLETCYFNSIWEPLREDDGSINGFIVVAHEITGQVLARKKIEQSEHKLRSAVDSAPFPIGVYEGREMRITLANQSMINVWGKGDDVIGKVYPEVLPELENQEIFDQLEEVFNTGIAFHAKEQRVDLVINGKLQPHYFNYSFTPLFDTTGKVYGVMNTAAELTDLIIAKQKVEEAEIALRGAVELAQLGTWELDAVTGTVTYSERLRSWFGFKNDYERLPSVYFHIHENDRQRVEDAVAQALSPGSNGIYDEEYTVVETQSGRERIVHAQGKTFFDTKGNPVKLSGTAQDVTQQRKAQKELERLVQQRTEQLQAKNHELQLSNSYLEEFAHAASHDLKEPIRKIHVFTTILKNELADRMKENETAIFNRVETATRRMGILIDDLLSYSYVNQKPLEQEVINLNEKLKRVTEDLELLIQEKDAVIEVAELPEVKGYRRQLQQLFQNLIINAIKYSKPGTRPVVNITGATVLGKDTGYNLLPTEQEKYYHLIKISDNGIGFEQKYAERIFKMFQRLHTNAEYKGTGVGLSIARKVVENHNGFIYATGISGEGATFYVGLPVLTNNEE